MEFFGVKSSTWSHKKNELLDHFSLYYEYDVEYKGRNTNYRIIKKLADYQKPPNKRAKEIRDATYADEIVEVIEKDPVQTAKNVARIIQDHPAIEAFNHAESTVYEYTRVRMRLMFSKAIHEGGTAGMILDKVWCRLDHEHNAYILMDDEAVKAFRDLFRAERDSANDAELEILNDYQIGLISKSEMDQ